MPRKRHASPSAQAAGTRKQRKGQPYLSEYQYDLLHPGQMRILVLDAGSEDDELSGTLETVNIKDGPAYKAISYTWGEPMFSETLRLSRREIRITPSLAGALQRFRSTKGPVRLWADAVCINQNPATEDGFAEKNHQVSMMGEIYSNAEEVLIWLGEADDRDTMFFAIMSILLDLEQPLDPETGEIDEDIASRGVQSLPGLEPNTWVSCRCCPRLAPLHADSWPAALEATVDFWDKPWFRRMWVLQEAQLARTASLFCGTHQMPWADVKAAHRFLACFILAEAEGRPDYNLLMDRIDSSDFFGSFNFRHYSGNDVWAMVLILHETLGFAASVPHDHLFALRGLNNAVKALIPSPDYTVPYCTLYSNISASLLTSRKCWFRGPSIRREVSNTLARACVCRAAKDDLLPSWSLIHPPTTLTLGRSQSPRAIRPFDNVDSGFAAGGTMCEASMPRRIGQDELRFGGFKLGVLEDMLADSSLPALFDPLEKPRNCVLSGWIKQCADFVKTCITESNSLDVFTLMTILFPHTFDEQKFEKFVDSISSMVTVDENACVDPDDSLSGGFRRNNQASDIKGVSFDGAYTPTHQHPWILGATYFHTKHDVLLAKSSDGRFCWVPPSSVIGDSVCLLNGVTMPFILRPTGKDRYRLIGPAYVHGAMYGEAWPEPVQRDDTCSEVAFNESDIDNGKAFYDIRQDENDPLRRGVSGLLQDFVIV